MIFILSCKKFFNVEENERVKVLLLKLGRTYLASKNNAILSVRNNNIYKIYFNIKDIQCALYLMKCVR